ncbi:hypothetical protein GCM10011515_26040 [Tsuneonella deserti]|uniref:KTSC domain-containing protein n=1 Tax=Tsuneonella deserti TaxID=2035528 RepID=A0ABQ1SB43_9SPHN|nr:KTSC domain-containing protein [Tsuneonella deserti]GGE05298.1 hypothetical protein GCM10011515_26040 [Tsuneonella deserti]
MPSTVIRRVVYLPELSVLDIEFVTGRIYRYLAVPEGVAAEFTRVRSKGGCFNRALRGRFEFVELDEWSAPAGP